jgi:hypothetical protein
LRQSCPQFCLLSTTCLQLITYFMSPCVLCWWVLLELRIGWFRMKSNKIRVSNSRSVAWAEHLARMGKKKYACWVLVGKSERTRTFERPSLRWKENIKVPPSSEKSSELQLVLQWILKNISFTKRKLRVYELLFDFILFILASKNKTKI